MEKCAVAWESHLSVTGTGGKIINLVVDLYVLGVLFHLIQFLS